MQKFKVKGQSVPKIEWKQTDGGDCITFHANAVGNKKLNCRKHRYVTSYNEQRQLKS